MAGSRKRSVVGQGRAVLRKIAGPGQKENGGVLSTGSRAEHACACLTSPREKQKCPNTPRPLNSPDQQKPAPSAGPSSVVGSALFHLGSFFFWDIVIFMDEFCAKFESAAAVEHQMLFLSAVQVAQSVMRKIESAPVALTRASATPTYRSARDAAAHTKDAPRISGKGTKKDCNGYQLTMTILRSPTQSPGRKAHNGRVSVK
jgi:hypothetical protein